MANWGSACGPVVIGGDCDSQINYGETIRFVMNYTNEDESPIDLTDAELSVFSSSPAAIKDHAVLSVIDAENGQAEFILHRDFAQLLSRGADNKFRIQTIFGPNSDDITPDIVLVVS